MNGNKNQLITWLLTQDDEKVFDITEHKEKRRLTQNSYYWVLVNQLSNKLGISKEELHFNLLKDYSIRYQILLPSGIEPRGIKYYEKKSKIIKGENEFTVYMVYTPSHELKKEEFAILINGLVEECKLQDIETMTPDKIKELELL